MIGMLVFLLNHDRYNYYMYACFSVMDYDPSIIGMLVFLSFTGQLVDYLAVQSGLEESRMDQSIIN